MGGGEESINGQQLHEEGICSVTLEGILDRHMPMNGVTIDDSQCVLQAHWQSVGAGQGDGGQARCREYSMHQSQ